VPWRWPADPPPPNPRRRKWGIDIPSAVGKPPGLTDRTSASGQLQGSRDFGGDDDTTSGPPGLLRVSISFNRAWPSSRLIVGSVITLMCGVVLDPVFGAPDAFLCHRFQSSSV
jgi:hypothetical protein